jgi:structural maintenance of chromosomes flexible hinge domain-containing protein 1
VASNGAIIVNEACLQRFVNYCSNKAECERVIFWQPRNTSNPHITAASEEVTFIPHPKTITMAGEWEYFAAGSQHPFPFAVAELIDNSLRATRTNKENRSIVVSLIATAVSSGKPSAGLVSVWDNGCGMSMRQLNDWAVMNLTMEDRGQQPQDVESARCEKGTAAAKQLHSDLSFFGVGSKNAAFFMGRSIRVASKSVENVLVHEMEICADNLEHRYRVSPDMVRIQRTYTP